jgi:hypothetical protein
MGLGALRMRRRISRYSETDITPDSTGDRNQDPTAKRNFYEMLGSYSAEDSYCDILGYDTV